MKLDEAFSTAVLEDDLPHSAGQREIWKRFWGLVFGEGYRPPTREKVATEFLPKAADSITRRAVDYLRNCSALCVSVYGFSDAN